MSPLLFAALVAILSVQPNLRISRISEPVKVVVSQSSTTVVTNFTYGWTTCSSKDGKGHVDIIVTVERESSQEHEALHAASCALTGAMKGGLLPGGATGDDHDWVHWAMANPEQAIKIMEARR
jgi:hypothetical protein